MKFAKTFLILAAFGMAFVGCSNSRQHKDPSWTAKPMMLQVVYTVPVDPIELPGTTKTLSDWLWSNVDNTLKFNAASHYKLNEISKELVSYSKQEADGDSIQVPKLSSMSDSADVYLIYDNFKFESSTNFEPGAAGPSFGMGGGMMVGVMTGRTHGCVKISASYAYYDAKNGKLLDYGFLEEKGCVDGTAVEHDWQNALRNLVLHTIDKTPIAQF